MKIGLRKPSLKKMLSARTTGAAKRKLKKALIPGYGQKGMGWRDPKKKIYNKIYNKTTVSASDLLKASKKSKKNNNTNDNSLDKSYTNEPFTIKDVLLLLFWPLLLTFYLLQFIWSILIFLIETLLIILRIKK